jgi:prolyl-tRNA synthetase
MEQLAWLVLRAANRSQAKSSTARLIVPRAPEVAEELGMDLTDAQFGSVEEYLQGHGYVVPADIGLAWGTYTVTPAGLRWLGASSAERSATNWLRELASKPSEEAAFESAIRAELEQEQHRIEEFERELGEVQWEPEPEDTEPRLRPGDAQTSEERPWWRFWG